MPGALQDALRLLASGAAMVTSPWHVVRKLPGSRLLWETREMSHVAPHVVSIASVVHVRVPFVDQVAWIRCEFGRTWARAAEWVRRAAAP